MVVLLGWPGLVWRGDHLHWVVIIMARQWSKEEDKNDKRRAHLSPWPGRLGAPHLDALRCALVGQASNR